MKNIKHTTPFSLEEGTFLPEIDLTYHTYGKINDLGDNVVWVCHALTADSDAKDWWSGLIGEGKILDPKKYFIICANNLGSCYGSTNPKSINPKTKKPYGKNFPLITIRDMANAHDLLRVKLKINHIHLLIGGSMGGQQVLEWAVQSPEIFKNICVLATNAQHSPWGIAFNESQRMALYADPSLYIDSEEAGRKGLEAARSIALLSYRNQITYNNTQTEQNSNKLEDFRASSYQQYQGKKLRERFNALSYLSLSKAMDSHNVGRERSGIENALQRIKSPTLVIGIDTDILFPPEEQKLIAKHIPNSNLEIIESDYGHDGFLIEFEKISALLKKFLRGDLKRDKEYCSTLPGSELF